MTASAYAALRAAFQRIDALPVGPERDRAVDELRAMLGTLGGDEMRQLLLEANRPLDWKPARDPAERRHGTSAPTDAARSGD